MKRAFAAFTVLFCLATTFACGQEVFPLPVKSKKEIGHLGTDGYLPHKFEPSGAVWHAGRQSLIVVGDGGQVAELDDTGHVLALWSLPGDLEAVTIKDSSSSLVYVGVEHPDGVVEFDLDTGKPTGEAWDLRPWLKGRAKRGLEALTFGNGVFFAGLQENGKIFKFHLLPEGEVQFLGELPRLIPRKDISGLCFDHESGHLFAVHDHFDLMVELTENGEVVRSYTLPGDGQEGLAFGGKTPTGDGILFLSFDGGQVWSLEVSLPK